MSEKPDADRDRVILILTAAVTPNTAGKTALNNPRERLAQYRTAVGTLIRSKIHKRVRVIVVETTGFPLDDLKSELGVQDSDVDLFAYTPSEDELSRGKGAAELAALRHVIESKIPEGENQTIYKLTGRLILADAERQLAPLRPRQFVVRGTIDGRWFDTRFIGASREVWNKFFIAAAEKLDDERGMYLERVLAASVAGAVAEGMIDRSQFARRPILIGSSGSTGRTYSALRERAKSKLLRFAENALVTIGSKKQV